MQGTYPIKEPIPIRFNAHAAAYNRHHGLTLDDVCFHYPVRERQLRQFPRSRRLTRLIVRPLWASTGPIAKISERPARFNPADGALRR
jgi:hypothetical protein